MNLIVVAQSHKFNPLCVNKKLHKSLFLHFLCYLERFNEGSTQFHKILKGNLQGVKIFVCVCVNFYFLSGKLFISSSIFHYVFHFIKFIIPLHLAPAIIVASGERFGLDYSHVRTRIISERRLRKKKQETLQLRMGMLES